jgi:hypothetical protein
VISGIWLTIGAFSIVSQEVPMTEERVTPLRQRMIEDMRIRGMGEKAQKAHIRAIKDFSAFLGRSPDTATPEDLRAYQLHMTDTGVTPSTFNVRIVALRFFFGMTCGREEMKRYMQFRTEPRKLPVVFSVEEGEGHAPERHPDGSTGARDQVSGGAQHLVWCRAQGRRGLQSQDRRHRQRSDADPCRAGQGA